MIDWTIRISLEPLLFVLSVELDSQLNETIDFSRPYALHTLSDEQKHLIEKSHGEGKIGNDHINGIAYAYEE